MRFRPVLAIAAALIPAAMLTGATASATDSLTSSASPSASASPSPTDEPTCSHELDDKFMPTTVSGETPHISAGDGWHGLTVKVENVSDTARQNITVEVGKFAYERAPDFPAERQEYVNIQRWDKESRTWAEIPWGDQELEGRLPPIDVAPGKTVTLQLRISVDEDFPPGSWPEMETEFIGSGSVAVRLYNPDGEWACQKGVGWYFDIPQPGTGPADASATTTAPTGVLAHIGSSATLPVIGLIGGATVVLGAGAGWYVVRRRRAGTDAG